MNTSKDPLLVIKERASISIEDSKTVKSLSNFDSIVFVFGKQRQTKFVSTHFHPQKSAGPYLFILSI